MTPRQYARARAIADDERADSNERDNARRMCLEYEAAYGKPATAFGKRPWWTLKIARKECAFWLDNGREFRNALRALREGRRQYEYVFEWQTVKAVQDGDVDWAWFSEREPWRLPSAMRAVYNARDFMARLVRDEQLVEWPKPRTRLGTPKKRRGLRDGELPGRRTVKKDRKARKA